MSTSSFSISDSTFMCRPFVKMLSSTESWWNPNDKSTFDNKSLQTNTFWKPSNSHISPYLICVLLILCSATVSNGMSCYITENTLKSLNVLNLCSYLYQSKWNLIKKTIFVWQALFKVRRDKATLKLTSIKCMTVLQFFFNWIPLQLFMSLNLTYWYPVRSEIPWEKCSLEGIRLLSSNEDSNENNLRNNLAIFSDK